jgi:Ser/Thr protein kinase RdoA (MazF antagonist)
MNRFQPGAAERALEHWEADAGSLRHLATSGNAVYRFRAAGEDRILRLTDPAHRTADHNRAEMRFLQHLARAGVPACTPVPSRSGALVESFEDGSACVLTWAPGERVEPGSQYWNAAFFREWGAHLARIHRAAIGYAGPARWAWREEGLIAQAPALIPADDAVSREELERVLARLDALPRRSASYGMVHADFAPANFHYRPGTGITSFDFGNCCAHWFVSDLAISLSVLRRFPERDRYRDWILAGYREVLTPDPEAFEHLSWFLRLRIVYVYLSRLRAFGPEPDTGQREILRALRAAVAERFEWN